MQLYAVTRPACKALVRERPAQGTQGLSICADGMGELSYHLGEHERALSHYDDARARPLPQTLAAAVSQRQVPSFLEYQRALVLRDQGHWSMHSRLSRQRSSTNVRCSPSPTQPRRSLAAFARAIAAWLDLGAAGCPQRSMDRGPRGRKAARGIARRGAPEEKRFRLAYLAALLTLGGSRPDEARMAATMTSRRSRGPDRLVKGTSRAVPGRMC